MIRWWEKRLREAPRDGVARRRFLQHSLWLSGAAMLAPLAGRTQTAARPRFVAEPFALGVASGYPRPDGFSLWTRLAPAPLLPDGGMPPEMHELQCEIARDEGFADIAQRSSVRCYPELGHSVHLDVSGLEPDREYHYRFIAGDAVSRVGRARTAPAAGQAVAHYRLAFASCQNYEHGYFSAYRQMLKDAPHLVMFLGDYIYENQWGSTPVRRHLGPECQTLGEYRTRHAQYKLDPDLQAMHAACPFVLTWDDHEVDNDYAGDVSENLDPQFWMRRAAAYQAYYEHQPLPRAAAPQRGEVRLYRHLDIGDLLRIYLLDNRQYRSPQGCPTPNRHGSSYPSDCAELADPARTMLGAAQEQWFAARCRDSRARWDLVAQQTLVAPMDETPGPGHSVWTDGWDGYPAARARMLEALKAARRRNIVFAGGDLHCTVVGQIPGRMDEVDSAPVASEFLATALAAEGFPPERFVQRRADNPHLLHMDGAERGYVRFDLSPQRIEASLVAVSDIREREPSITISRQYLVEDGRPGPRPA